MHYSKKLYIYYTTFICILQQNAYHDQAEINHGIDKVWNVYILNELKFL